MDCSSSFLHLDLCKKAVSEASEDVRRSNSLIVMEQEIERVKAYMLATSNFDGMPFIESEFNEFENFIERCRAMVYEFDDALRLTTNDENNISDIYFYPLVCGHELVVYFYRFEGVVCVSIKLNQEES